MIDDPLYEFGNDSAKKERLEQTLSVLNPLERIVFTLFHSQNVSISEIAETLPEVGTKQIAREILKQAERKIK